MWLWWEPYAKGCDEHQRNALEKCQFGACNTWGYHGASRPNPWLEYPRFTVGRFPRLGCEPTAALERFLDIFNCDTVSEQILSPAVVYFSTVACFLTAFILTMKGDAWEDSGMGDLTRSVSGFWQSSVLVLVNIVFFALIGLGAGAVSRLGNNTACLLYTSPSPRDS